MITMHIQSDTDLGNHNLVIPADLIALLCVVVGLILVVYFMQQIPSKNRGVGSQNCKMETIGQDRTDPFAVPISTCNPYNNGVCKPLSLNYSLNSRFASDSDADLQMTHDMDVVNFFKRS